MSAKTIVFFTPSLISVLGFEKGDPNSLEITQFDFPDIAICAMATDVCYLISLFDFDF